MEGGASRSVRATVLEVVEGMARSAVVSMAIGGPMAAMDLAVLRQLKSVGDGDSTFLL